MVIRPLSKYISTLQLSENMNDKLWESYLQILVTCFWLVTAGETQVDLKTVWWLSSTKRPSNSDTEPACTMAGPPQSGMQQLLMRLGVSCYDTKNTKKPKFSAECLREF